MILGINQPGQSLDRFGNPKGNRIGNHDQGRAIMVRGIVIGINRQIPVGKARIAEMIGIGFGLPGPNLVHHFGHVGHHLDQHDRFIEMVEIVSGQKAFFRNIGRTQPRAIGIIDVRGLIIDLGGRRIQG